LTLKGATFCNQPAATCHAANCATRALQEVHGEIRRDLATQFRVVARDARQRVE